MKPKSRVSAGFLTLTGAVLLISADRAGAQTAETPTAECKAGADRALSDMPLPSFQRELLDIAFRAASALPILPHVKDRSRSQEAVVGACLELDQPRMALGYIEGIANWRRGAAYADLAFYCAQRGHAAAAQDYLGLARQVADAENETMEDFQSWRRDRILVKIAGTHVWLGQTQEAARLQSGVVDSEAGRVEAVKAALVDSERFEEHFKALEALVATGNFDTLRNALDGFAELYDGFYGDKDRRTQLEEKMKSSWGGAPAMLRIELLMKLAGSALEHEDRGRATGLTKEAQALTSSEIPRPEDRIPLMARSAALLHRAGDEEKGRSEIAAALGTFETERESIADMYRREALVPIAESYQSMNETASALAVYKLAVDEGALNVNTRPRAEDLCATCLSMALHGVEPDGDLWGRIKGVCKGLDSQ